ncbi:Alpha/Beta hydrolase protein [Dichotomopilus funicola]|uniref:Alpha/Beta hydrolase protein n=1 Tax=Dichotomopilus funicola TaxID=1934379 RepID=A0AAN6VAS8_9PEZI|nr:Alpha/Beta hydrolase protein [Dichotomopilus funicola]
MASFLPRIAPSWTRRLGATSRLRDLLSACQSTRLTSTRSWPPPARPQPLEVRHGKLLTLSGAGYRAGYRNIHIPTVLLPPVLFTGLLVGLWIWKCIMMVVFQNKIIYMPSLPPTSRREQISNWASMCGGVEWAEETTVAADGTKLTMAMTTVPLPRGRRPAARAPEKPPTEHAYVLYFQGNASSIPPRLPDLSWVLRAVSDSKAYDLAPMRLTFVCLSYRGYWTSRGRPSEPGLRLDAEAGIQWIAEKHEQVFGKDGTIRPILLLWGQSIGSGVATNLAATGRISSRMPISGLLLETPFVSIREMLETLYPQKWLPYKYLWPFLRNHLDSWGNLGIIAQAYRDSGRTAPMVHILEAGRDELVPKEQGEELYKRCVELGLPFEKEAVPTAYHQQAIARGDGKKLAAHAILKLIKKARDNN